MIVDADSFFLLTAPGQHEILSDKNVVIQEIHWPLTPPIQGIESFGTVIPCIQKVDATTDVKLTPIAAEGFPTTYVIIVAVVAVAAAAAVAMCMIGKRGTEQQPTAH